MDMLPNTPFLLLDQQKLEANLDRMQQAANGKSVLLRPHLKTAKSLAVAEKAMARGAKGITVSTLLEAEYFFDGGIADIIYAVGMTADKLDRAMDLVRRGADLKIMTDNLVVAQAIADHGHRHGHCHKTLIELDCGDHRAGLLPEDPDLPQIAAMLESQGKGGFAGVLTHAGHSYGENTPAGIEKIANEESDCARRAVAMVTNAGFEPGIVSIGSTPTALALGELDGVTEIRAGVYMFFDVDQMARGVCNISDLALSVVSTVIGHNRAAGKILLDAGGLALSKDRSADSNMAQAGYGLVCDLESGRRLDGLSVTAVSQEHGHVKVSDERDYVRLPIGAKIRILPIHACMTAAAYPHYHVLHSGKLVALWERVNGW
ncbi:alanine racemase [Aestuariispira insulae]|uniref:D-serine deaminase-like pyridoxal phosphate-dependent protein n=1 Tax=Aestuariispira insulae TaxID=1461337 RepID=A0A3D9HXG2_9PROT|nr:alanine racemase [Aestuariispira insulae]RED54061.1 D-serine deaminase-like pyridoxal phosphate-dependent protein [Aestuariispira insulae]